MRGQDDPNRIESGKVVLATVRVQNNGTGNASRVSAHARTWREVFVAGDGNTYFEPGDISAGKFVEFAFLIYTGASVKKGEKIPVTIYLHEARPQFDVVSPLILPSGGSEWKCRCWCFVRKGVPIISLRVGQCQAQIFI